ncbi:MAG TPA: 6-phosphofructokinase, partial [Mycobacterium sp.]|nr:6-phosphofructokinase [Mycobacterium sp.]
WPYDTAEVCELLRARHASGAQYSIVVVSEGARSKDATADTTAGAGVDAFGHARLGGVAVSLSSQIEERTGFETRYTILGHVQRGGTPTAYDRVLATRFGVNATDAAHAGEYGMMVSLRGQDIGRVALADATRQLKLVPESRYDDAAAFFG